MPRITVHRKGELTPENLQPGDFLLTGIKSQGLVSWAIKVGSWLRGHDKLHRRFSHTVLVTSIAGDTIEAVSHGVVADHVSRFADDDYVVVRTHASQLDQMQIIDFANAVIDAKYKYGFVTFAGLAIYCLTGGQLCIQKAGTAICSGLVADALTRAGYIWERPPYAMMPADLAKHFNVTWAPGE